MYDITSSIVLYKSNPAVLLQAINSFLNTELLVKLYLVDNSPEDTLRDISSDERVEYIFNPANPGFGAGHNIAIRLAMDESKYHLILNPDIRFELGVLESLFNFMQQRSQIGLVMPKVLYPDGSIQYLCKTNPKPFDLFARRFLPGFLQKVFKKRMEEYEYRHENYNEEMYNIPYLSGCFMFIRTEMFQKVGLFDERIFMYIEDADMTRRILEVTGTAYYPKAEVYHNYEKGSYKNWRLTLYNIHGAFIYFNKWGWF